MKRETSELIQLSFFTNIARSIAATNTLEETLDEVMRQVCSIFNPRTWSLLLRDTQTGELVFSVVTGGREANAIRGTRLPPGRGIAGWIVDHRCPLIIDDVSIDPRFDPSVDALTNFQTKSIIGVPLISRDRVFGVIELINRLNGEAFSAIDLKILTTIADFAAVAIEKSYYLKALRAMALTDELTGVANRRSLMHAIEREKAHAKRLRSQTALLSIDIDNFKQINDTYGHPAGDRVLKHLATLLSSQVREVDTVARIGGDEFAVFMPRTTQEQADEVCQRILKALAHALSSLSQEESSPTNEETISYAVSIGAHSAGPSEIPELFTKADLFLYKEKNAKSPSSAERVEELISRFLFDDEQAGCVTR